MDAGPTVEMQPLPDTSQEEKGGGVKGRMLDFFPFPDSTPSFHLITNASIGQIYLIARGQWNLGNVVSSDTECGRGGAGNGPEQIGS